MSYLNISPCTGVMNRRLAVKPVFVPGCTLVYFSCEVGVLRGLTPFYSIKWSFKELQFLAPSHWLHFSAPEVSAWFLSSQRALILAWYSNWWWQVLRWACSSHEAFIDPSSNPSNTWMVPEPTETTASGGTFWEQISHPRNQKTETLFLGWTSRHKFTANSWVPY